MTVFREFEIRAIELMSGSTLDQAQLAAIRSIQHVTRYEYTGSGYFLSVSHPLLPEIKEILAVPSAAGTSGDILCGFVVHLGGRELTLECHTWGAVDIPADFRDRTVVIGAADVNVIELR